MFRWYLGLGGIVLPGKGLGVETVEANSPADMAGLSSGMVITRCNGSEVIDEATMGEAIAASDGQLLLSVLKSADAEPVELIVEMKKLRSLSF